jgi:hypothetical protein
MPRARSWQTRQNAGVARLRYVVEVTAEEVALGFDVLEHTSGAAVVMLRLDGGLRAVKIKSEDGRVVYAFCDANLQPLYPNASSLDELKSRFRAAR